MLGSKQPPAGRARRGVGSSLPTERARGRPGTVIPYDSTPRPGTLLPDYLICLKRNDGSELNLILEVKGFQTEPDRAKETTAQRWVKAVNHHGGFGLWDLAVCRDPHKLESTLAAISGTS